MTSVLGEKAQVTLGRTVPTDFQAACEDWFMVLQENRRKENDFIQTSMASVRQTSLRWQLRTSPAQAP